MLPTVQVMDPALGGPGADYQAIGILKLDLARDWILVWEERLLRVSIPELVQIFLDLYEEHKPDLAGIEAVGFQVLLKIMVDEKGDARGLFPSVIAIQQHDSKDIRIRGLVPLNDRGRLRLASDGSTRGCERQLRAYPEGKKDGPDMIQMGVRLLRQATSTGAARQVRHHHGRRASFGRKGVW